jgi:hypothetical protein
MDTRFPHGAAARIPQRRLFLVGKEVLFTAL